jgi:hypothetical protein
MSTLWTRTFVGAPVWSVIPALPIAALLARFPVARTVDTKLDDGGDAKPTAVNDASAANPTIPTVQFFRTRNTRNTSTSSL